MSRFILVRNSNSNTVSVIYKASPYVDVRKPKKIYDKNLIKWLYCKNVQGHKLQFCNDKYIPYGLSACQMLDVRHCLILETLLG